MDHVLTPIGKIEGLSVRRVYGRVINGFMAHIADESALKQVKDIFSSLIEITSKEFLLIIIVII